MRQNTMILAFAVCICCATPALSQDPGQKILQVKGCGTFDSGSDVLKKEKDPAPKGLFGPLETIANSDNAQEVAEAMARAQLKLPDKESSEEWRRACALNIFYTIDDASLYTNLKAPFLKNKRGLAENGCIFAHDTCEQRSDFYSPNCGCMYHEETDIDDHWNHIAVNCSLIRIGENIMADCTCTVKQDILVTMTWGCGDCLTSDEKSNLK